MFLLESYDIPLECLHIKRHSLMDSLRSVLEELRQLETNIQQSGPVAPAGLWIDSYQPGGRDTTYVRLRADGGSCPKDKRIMGLKRLDSQEYRDWQSGIRRRDTVPSNHLQQIAIFQQDSNQS